MRLVGAVSQAGGQVNEDAWGTVGRDNDVAAAWVLDDVTGINKHNYLSGKTDAAWFVGRAQWHLQGLTADNRPLHEILHCLIELLIEDWRLASGQFSFPPDYDSPATCLTLLKRYAHGWHALRLGDSSLLAHNADGSIEVFAAPANDSISDVLAERAKQLRTAGTVEINSLLAEFQPQLLAQRKTRNTAGGLSILKADIVTLQFAEYRKFENVRQFLLCTDGFYSAVDCYALHDDSSLLREAMKGVEKVLDDIRKVEADDPECQKFIRFKATDDATAVTLSI